MIHFYIVRHGQTLLNSLDRAQGWTDSPLTNAGRQTAIDLGHKLKTIKFDAVYTSDMLRATQTAKIILEAGKHSFISIETDPKLREWCLGNMEAENNSIFTKNVADWLDGTASITELNARIPDVAEAIYKHDTTGMAEPFSIIEKRLKTVFSDAVQKNEILANSNVLLVTHAFAIKTIFYLFAPEQLGKIGKVKNAAVSVLKFDGGVYSLAPDLLLCSTKETDHD